jgi:glutaredoxin 3
MTIELKHHGVTVNIEEGVISDLANTGIDVVEEIKAGIDAALEDEVTDVISNSGTVIYTKPNCPYCVKAKAILQKRDIPYTELDAVALREQLIERVSLDTGTVPRTVPQIYLKGKYIGGHDQLVAYFERAATQ